MRCTLPRMPTDRMDRVQSIDILRGLVMLVMPLEHTIAMVAGITADPADMKQTYPSLFFARLFTAVGAPTFVFLAGLSIYFQSVHKTREELRKFLLTRGILLVLLEFTLVHLGWHPDPFYHFVMIQVIFVLGVSMIVTSALVGLSARWIGSIGLCIVFAHNAFDFIRVRDLSPPWSFLWSLAHEKATFEPFVGHTVYVSYPALPWFGLVLCGYGMGPYFQKGSLIRLGACLLAAFLILRALNVYGDPQPWHVQDSTTFTVMSFFNCQNPPSLLFLLMTTGPICILLGLFEKYRNLKWTKPLNLIGRVPLFFYLVHLPLIRYPTLILVVVLGVNLHGVLGSVLLWLIEIPILYWLCVKFSDYKSRHCTDKMLKYL